MEPVTVQYFKHPSDLHWRHELVRLGEDEHGVWLGGRRGAHLQRGQEPVIGAPRALVQLIQPGAWWSLIANEPGGRIHFYVDIVTPPVWRGEGRVEMVDLDLDVVRTHDGTIYIDDEDEWELHRRTKHYPPEWHTRVPQVATEVRAWLEQGRDPFSSVADRWLDAVRT